MKIGTKEVSNFGTPYIIAEIGSNHNGDIDLAKKIINAAKECGADAVKFQSWNDKSLISKVEYENNQKYNDSPKKHFGSLKEMVEKYYLRPEQHYELSAYCEEIGIVFSSSAFSEDEVDLLESLKVPFHKIASMDINNYRLLKKMGSTMKPILISTGMSTLTEIENAVRTVESTGNTNIILLHCISIYPPKYEDIHLNNITMLRNRFPNYPIGFSDHSIGISIPLAAIALGACIIEKHFTLDKDMPGWDHEISSDPSELSMIVTEGKNVSCALGSYQRIVSKDEELKKFKFRRSIVMSRDLSAGETIQYHDIDFKRPGTGISPEFEMDVIGRKIKRDIKYDEILNWVDLF